MQVASAGPAPQSCPEPICALGAPHAFWKERCNFCKCSSRVNLFAVWCTCLQIANTRSRPASSSKQAPPSMADSTSAATDRCAPWSNSSSCRSNAATSMTAAASASTGISSGQNAEMYRCCRAASNSASSASAAPLAVASEGPEARGAASPCSAGTATTVSSTTSGTAGGCPGTRSHLASKASSHLAHVLYT